MKFDRAIRALCALVLVAGAHVPAWAIDPFTVRDIRVEGLQRVEPGTVFATLPFQVGDTYNDDKASNAIRSLFALGLFKDIRIDVQGGVVVVIVEESPSIAEVTFTGAKEFDKTVLIKALRDIGLAEGRAFDRALVDRAEQELKRQYLNRSLYGAQVITTVTPIERNRVNVNFNLIEGDVAKIKSIRIVGSSAFSEETLRDLFELDTGGWLSWYTKSDRYSRAKLNADLESLRSYYLTRGYLEFKIDSTQVVISPDKQDIGITINITEGARYIVSAVRLRGDYLTKDDEFKTRVKIKPGQAYNAEEVAETVKGFTELFGTFGYAFAQVQANPLLDRSNNTAAIEISAEPSRRAYVRKINISGNNRTRDEVIRREFRQFEASWYDGDKIRLSRDRVDRLGFFTGVDFETSDVPGAPDQVDLNVKVVEKPTGNLSIGAGFSSSDKFSVQFRVQQDNVFGSGNHLSLDLNTSKYNRALALTHVDPYFTQEGVSRAVEVYDRTQKPTATDSAEYQLNTRGASLRFGVPFSELQTVFFGAGLEQTSIVPGTNLPHVYNTYAQKVGYKSTLIPLTVGWASDSRDSALVPTSGVVQRVNSEVGVGGDVRYIRAGYQYQAYVPLTKKYTLAFNSEFGWGKGLGSSPYPVFKTFYAGGLGSVRGFEQGTLGPIDVTGAYLGGPKKILGSVEFQTPFPGAGNDRTLRMFAFADIGNVFGEDQRYRLKDLRASMGVGLGWISPIGPLRLVFANPVRKQDGDKIQRVQFQIGTSF